MTEPMPQAGDLLPPPPPPPQLKRDLVEIAIDANDTFYLAAAHRPILRAVALTNRGAPADAEIVLWVTIGSPFDEPVVRELTAAVPSPEVNDTIVLNQLRLVPSTRALALLDEAFPTTIDVEAFIDGAVVGSASTPLTLLAYNQWMYRPRDFESLAAFVLPSHPALRPIMSRARDLLAERTGSSATEGYQGTDRGDLERTHAIARAVYDAIAEQAFDYSDPPAEFEGHGQRVRTPDLVVAERCCTCLDSTVLYASCLAAGGLDPVVFVLAGHAFAGYQTDISEGADPRWIRELSGRPVLDQPNEVAALLASGAIVPVETTTLTSSTPAPFNEAVERATDSARSVRGLVNVRRCRESGVVAIPSRRTVGDVTELVLDAPAGPHAVTIESALETTEQERERMAGFEAPPRVRKWLTALLDLTRSNPLLSLQTTSSAGAAKVRAGVMRLDLPAGMLATVEDRLMSSDQGVTIVPATRASGRLLDSDDLATDLATDFRSKAHLYFPSVPAARAHLERATADVKEQLPDAPPSRVRTIAEGLVEEHFTTELDRLVGGIRRRAREIETQVGSNNLFLTVGTLSWTDPGSSGTAAGSARLVAPLFLVPVRLAGSADRGFRLTVDATADVVPNYCLLEKFRQAHGVTLTELEQPELDDAGIDVNRMLNSVRRSLADARISDAVVEESAYLAVLNFSTFRLWKDMRDHWHEFMENSVVRHLVQTPFESYENPNETPLPKESELLLPIPADQSQLEAVRWAAAGRSFVIEGPPGTGKSQTITNLLAAAIANGQKVLFVAEKAAALSVVKRRLASVGLAPFCLDLHDKGSKPEQIRQQLRSSLDFMGEDQEAQWADLAARHSADAVALETYRHAVHTPNRAQLSAWSAHQELLAAGEGPTVHIERAFLDIADRHLPAVRAALLELPRVATSVSLAATAAWRLSDRRTFADLDQPALASALDELAALQRSIIRPELGGVLATIGGPPGFAAVASAIRAALKLPTASDSEIAEIADPSWAQRRDASIRALDTFTAEQAAVRAVFTDAVFGTDVSAVVAAGTEAATSGFFGRSKKERAFEILIAPFLREPGERPAGELVALLQRAVHARPSRDRVVADVVALPGASLATFDPLDEPAVAALKERLAGLPTAAACLQTPAGRAVRAATMVASWRPAEAEAETFERAGAWWTTVAALLQTSDRSAARWLRGRTFTTAWVADATVWSADAPRFLQLQRWCEVVDAVQPLRAAGLPQIAEELLNGSIPAEESYERFRRGVLEAALADRIEAGRLRQFDGLAHDRRVQAFRERDERRRELMRTLIPHRLVGARPMRPGTRLGKYGELERELSRVSRRLGIRKLMERYGDILPNLTPCFLMSPDSVARFLPPGTATFDLVVFDEASQIEVAEAIGAMGRSRAVVVVGDSKQMPPSKFGGTATVVADDDDMVDEASFEDLESILSECVESNLPRVWLQCHYRSRHEGLIAFSNSAFYEDRLTTFPSPSNPADTPIAWHHVENGEFLRSGVSREQLRTNPVEAAAVVAEILRRLDDPLTSAQSLCVVTLNIQQQTLVLQLLEQTKHERVRALLEDEGDAGLIVRNLESVQGDERDVVIFSIGFAAPLEETPDGRRARKRLPLNFGPLNKRGGERRLNVAVTRAREEVVVFCSFQPEDMLLAQEPSRGLELLRQYLLVARDGAGRVADLAVRAPSTPDLHRDELAQALRSRGLRVRENVGLSDFRVDLTVGAADRDDWPVAVLLDGPRWAARGTVYDRDVLPVNVLATMGWRAVERVWLPSWLQERERVLDDIEAAVRSASAVEPVVEDPAFDEAAMPTPVLGAPSMAAAPPPPPLAATTARHSTPDVEPSDMVLARASAFDKPPATGLESVFMPASTAVVGERSTLDAIGERAANSAIKAVILETAAAEAPVHIDRLGKIVATRFGLGAVRQARLDDIAKLVPSSLKSKSKFGIFVWSEHRTPDGWNGYRRTPPGSDRKIEHVAPEEIENAMVDAVRMGHSFETVDLIKYIAGIFGVARVSAGIQADLTAVLDWSVRRGSLWLDGSTVTLPGSG